MKSVIRYDLLGVYMIRVYLFLGLLLTGGLLFCPAEGLSDYTYVDSLAETPEPTPRRSDLDAALSLRDFEYLVAYRAQVLVEQGLRETEQLARVPDLKTIARQHLETRAVQTVIDSACYSKKEKRDALKLLFNLGVPFSRAQRQTYGRIKQSLNEDFAAIPCIATVMRGLYGDDKKD